MGPTFGIKSHTSFVIHRTRNIKRRQNRVETKQTLELLFQKKKRNKDVAWITRTQGRKAQSVLVGNCKREEDTKRSGDQKFWLCWDCTIHGRKIEPRRNHTSYFFRNLAVIRTKQRQNKDLLLHYWNATN